MKKDYKPTAALIAIDVDNTIIDHNNNLKSGIKDMIIRLFEHNTLWCWSHGGEEYARSVIKQHNLEMYFNKVLDKPFFYIDDLEACGMERLEINE